MTGKRKQIYYVVSQVHKSLAFEWISVRLRDRYDLNFILLNPAGSVLEDFLLQNNIPVTRLPYTKKKLPFVFLRLLWIFIRVRPEIVHTHLFDATLLGLTAAWIARIKRRIYTRHNSTYHHLYHPHAVKYDRWTNFVATEIISISQATEKVLIEQENVPPKKIVKIPHGFDFRDFSSIPIKRIKEVQEKWNIPDRGPRIGVVARHIEWKGVQYIIPAFKEFLKRYPDATIILANATGSFHDAILEQLKDIPSNNIALILFEEDIAALYRVFDIYIHTPIDLTCEAFGQTYVEALASETPSIFTLSGIAAEFVEDKRNALVVAFQDAKAIENALVTLWENKELQQALIERGKQDVISRFGIEHMEHLLTKLYDR